MTVDAKTKYVLNVTSHLGKGIYNGDKPLTQYFGQEFTKPIRRSGKILTIDWFTSVPLVTKLAIYKSAYKLFLVGTTNSKKR